MMRVFAVLLAAIMALTFAGAALAQDPIADTYRLGSGDRLRVTVFGEADLGGEYVVDDAGAVRLPLIGEVDALGVTIPQFEAAIIEKLSDGFLRTPRVSVEVINYRPFYILGEVNSPGQYTYVAGMNILNAVALAGGYTYRANETRVFIRRGGSEEEQPLPANEQTTVLPGDIIRVAERFF